MNCPCTDTREKHERVCSQRGWMAGLMTFTVCSVYGGVVVCNDPFNTDLWCPAYSGSELGVCASGPEQTLTSLSSFVVLLFPSLIYLFPYITLPCFYFHIDIYFWSLSLLWSIHVIYFFQGVQLRDLLVHTQPLHCLLHHPHGAHGGVGAKVEAVNLSVCVCVFMDLFLHELVSFSSFFILSSSKTLPSED